MDTGIDDVNEGSLRLEQTERLPAPAEPELE